MFKCCQDDTEMEETEMAETELGETVMEETGRVRSGTFKVVTRCAFDPFAGAMRVHRGVDGRQSSSIAIVSCRVVKQSPLCDVSGELVAWDNSLHWTIRCVGRRVAWDI